MNPFEPPTPKQHALYKRWLRYFRDSRLIEEERKRRAAEFAMRNEPVPKD